VQDTTQGKCDGGKPPGLTECELTIDIWPGYSAEYRGTAAALQAEGLVPEGFEWPPLTDGRRWSSGPLWFWLRRTRPEGHKGPLRSWRTLDSWAITVTTYDATRQGPPSREPRRQAGHPDTPRRARAARADPAFQRFRGLIPGLPAPRHSRRAAQGTGAEGQA
jgi:hypothetical protein